MIFSIAKPSVTGTTERMLALEGADAKPRFGARILWIGFHAHWAFFAHVWLFHGPLVWATATRIALTARRSHAEKQEEAVRRVPADYSHSDKEHYIQIAMRAQSEQVNSYSVLCMGLQSYLASRKLARTLSTETSSN